ncbi:serine hydrolase [Allobranchiibius sp. GilTou73]|uniref:serine hydrolase domain-containing protein n=1 Tax=Allobranchiibius sp. GilTou73 TaxID=2904523 RepID=UPI001F1D6404|nr:serine hydrolase domain-containing protein [Allobranchiibius sp. GilTou73]UIJ33782.1 beta-lactamase family protein [Allobranchiibius sp. GilTou73]
MTDDHDPTTPHDPATEDTRRTPRWMRSRKTAVAGITAVVLAGGWAVSSTPGAQAAYEQADAVNHQLDRTSANLDRLTADHHAGGGVRNTAPKDAAFQRSLDALVTRDGIPGVEAFVRQSDGKVRSYTAGVGNLNTRTPVPADGEVRIASNTKTFTATAVLQLVGEGRIGLDKPIETYLPGLVRGKGIDGRHITVRNLLQQTSGLPDYDTLVASKGLLAVQHTYFEPRQALDAALTAPAEFKPGTSWAYSNTNYVLAGLIVQRVTGRPIGEVITQRVIDRLGLRHTYWPNTGVQTIRGRHAQAYFRAKPGANPVNVTELDPSLGWAAGQLISTPSDLSTFNRALLDGKLLAPAQQQQLLTTVAAPGFEPEKGWSYGLGFAKRTLSCGVQAWGHGGDITGFETRNLTTRDGRSVVIATTALPTKIEGLVHVNAAVQQGICDMA